MANPMFNPPTNYSGVTIQIANPAVNLAPPEFNNAYANKACLNSGYSTISQSTNGITPIGYSQNPFPVNQYTYPQNSYENKTAYSNSEVHRQNMTDTLPEQVLGSTNKELPNIATQPNYTYPAQYYLNNYNYGINGSDNNIGKNLPKSEKSSQSVKNVEQESIENNLNDNNRYITDKNELLNNHQRANSSYDHYTDGLNAENHTYPLNSYKMYAKPKVEKDTDLSRSQNIIGDLSEREAELEEEKKNSKETKIVALTDEYIKSLENYLNNPNDEIRLMASKEILTRLDEDKSRYDDAALNALLNKMLQDPSKLVRIASLSAFASQLASGNDYTVNLLHNIQSNPNADKEDVLQAADILLKMSAGVEVKNIPNPAQKNENSNNKKA